MKSESEALLEAASLRFDDVFDEDIPAQDAECSPTFIDVGVILAARYRLTAFLGKAGSSRVFKAVDQLASMPGAEATPSVIVIKVLTESLAGASRFADLSARYKSLRQLAHPNIARLFGCERDGSIAFITIEYVAGESTQLTLCRTVGAALPFEARKARRMIATVAKAVEYAHERGVVHGDLKPSNVIVNRESECKIINFGMSDRLDHPHQSIDVFGLACFAYELLTGIHPFERESGVRNFNSTPLHRPEFTPWEYTALLRALQVEPNRRTPSVRGFMAEFTHLPPRSSSLVWPICALAAAVGVATGIHFLTQHESVFPSRKVMQSIQPSAPTARPVQSNRPVAPPTVEPPTHVASAVGAVIQDCASCPPMTVLPPGQFQQGAPDADHDAVPLERPQHPGQIRYSMAMSTTDITVDDFRHFAEATGQGLQGCDIYDGKWRLGSSASWLHPGFSQTPRHPVVCVWWSHGVA